MLKECVCKDGQSGYICECGIEIPQLRACRIKRNNEVIHVGHKACMEAKFKELHVEEDLNK